MVGEEEAKSRGGNWYFPFPQKMLSFVYTQYFRTVKAIHAGYIFLACKKLAKHNLYPHETLYNGTFPKNFGYSKYQGDLQVLKKAPEQILNCSRAIIIVYKSMFEYFVTKPTSSI